MSRKCELNFTTRQLAKRCEVSHSTIARWLKKAVTDGVLKRKYRKVNSSNKIYRAMRFYTVNSVVKILNAIARKKTYSVVKKLIKQNPKNVTLKYILKNIRIKNRHGKVTGVSKTRLNILAAPDYFDFMVPLGKNGAWIALSGLDARTFDAHKKIKKASNEFIDLIFRQMIADLS